MREKGRATSDGLLWSAILGGVVASAVALLIWTGRHTLFSVDDLLWFMGSPGLDPDGLLQPHNGHLIAVPRLLYRAAFELFGADYGVIRVLTALAAGATGVLFFIWASRRADRLVALAGMALLLVLGSSYIFLIAGDGLMLQLALSCGLGALLALERGDTRGDGLAAALLCLAVLTYSVALAFIAAAVVAVLLGPDTRRRLWIPALPAIIYFSWWIWAQGHGNDTIDQGQISNALVAPAYVFQSLSSALGALTGLDYDFATGPVRPEFETNTPVAGPTLALAAIAVVAWRLRLRPVPPALWVALGFVAALWGMGALTADAASPPNASRFVFPVSVGVLAVAAAASTGLTWTRGRLVVLWLIVLCGLAANVLRLHDGGEFRRSEAAQLRAELTAVELVGRREQPRLDLSKVAGGGAIVNFPFTFAPDPIGDYLDAVDRYGTVGFTRPELLAQPEEIRARTDSMLIGTFGVGLEPGSRRPQNPGCVEYSVAESGVGFELPGRGAVLESRGVSGPVEVRRFADLSWIAVGEVRPRGAVVIRPPRDGASDPWYARVPGGSVGVCPL